MSEQPSPPAQPAPAAPPIHAEPIAVVQKRHDELLAQALIEARACLEQREQSLRLDGTFTAHSVDQVDQHDEWTRRLKHWQGCYWSWQVMLSSNPAMRQWYTSAGYDMPGGIVKFGDDAHYFSHHHTEDCFHPSDATHAPGFVLEEDEREMHRTHVMNEMERYTIDCFCLFLTFDFCSDAYSGFGTMARPGMLTSAPFACKRCSEHWAVRLLIFVFSLPF